MNFFNTDTGAKRETFRESEMPIQLKKKCPLPCFRKSFLVNIDTWHDWDIKPTLALKLMLDGLTVTHREEYLQCDLTCIVGNLGGNIGFYFGVSILLGLDVIFGNIRRMNVKTKIQSIKNKIHNIKKRTKIHNSGLFS